MEEKLKQIEEDMQKIYMQEFTKLEKNEQILGISYFEDMNIIPEEALGISIEEDTYLLQKEVIKDGETSLVYKAFVKHNKELQELGEGKADEFLLKEEYLAKLKENIKGDMLEALKQKMDDIDNLKGKKLDLVKTLQENKEKELLNEPTEKIEENIKLREADKANGLNEPQKTKSTPEVNKKIEKTKEQLLSMQGTQCLIIRENSNFYKDHEELWHDEPNLFFIRDNDGVVKARYIDKETGKIKASQHIEDSKTEFRTVISLDKDGRQVEKQIPYQMMSTKGLTNDKTNVRDIKMSVNFGPAGYMDIEEARQGKDGEEYVSHDVEVMGRDYNSQIVNDATNDRTKAVDPSKTIEGYKQVENTGYEEKDGIQLAELKNREEQIEAYVKEGYQKSEAEKIYGYIVGPERLTEEEAKEKVMQEITEERKKEQENIGHMDRILGDMPPYLY